MIEGNKIYLRPLEREDMPYITEWRNRKETRRNFFHKSLLSLSRQHKWFESYMDDRSKEIFIAISKEDGKPVGMIGLSRIDYKDQKAEMGNTTVGYSNIRGKGIATEMKRLMLEYAFTDLGLHRVYAYVLKHNSPMIRVNEKCGFKIEGVLKEDHYANGRFHDVLLLGITRGDWEQLQQEQQSPGEHEAIE